MNAHSFYSLAFAKKPTQEQLTKKAERQRERRHMKKAVKQETCRAALKAVLDTDLDTPIDYGDEAFDTANQMLIEEDVKKVKE